jgi:SNF2 family DNA or RNA helicase
LKILIVGLSPRKRDEYIAIFNNSDFGLLVMNFDQFIVCRNSIELNKYGMIIIDEAHKLSSVKTLAAEAALGFLKRTETRVLMLTGTPI